MSTISNSQPYSSGHMTARPNPPASGVPLGSGIPDDGPASPHRDLAAAAIQSRARRRSQTRLGRRLARILGRSRLHAQTALGLLAAEADHIGPGRNPDQPSHGEIMVQQAGQAAASRALARSQSHLAKRAEEIEAHQAKRAELIARTKHHDTDRIRHPEGGRRPLDETLRDEQAQRAQIADERAGGSRKHQRMPRWIGCIPRVVLVADACLLVYFFAGITDVDWARPLSADLAFALILTAMVTVLSYGFLSFTGHRLRSFKDHSGAIAFADLDGLTKFSAAAATVAIVVLSALMFTRMRTEVIYALGPGSGATALLIAVAIAIVSALANLLVVFVHALDGSDQTARLEALSSAVNRPLSRIRKMQVDADIIPGHVAVLRRRAHRAAARALVDADTHTAAAAQIIRAARARHQNAGPHATLSQDQSANGYYDPATALVPDLRQLNVSLEHINSELPLAGQPESS